MNLLQQILPLVLVSSLRFFGLFVVMPVISIYAISLGASPLIAGLAVGGYALTQIIFQIPFGILGDRYDKHLIIALGLVIFIIGSLLCALTDNVYLLVLGRMLQGSGAIASVISALISDLSPAEHRTKAMAFMGAGISIAFLFAMLLGPLIGGHYGIKVLFYITAFLALLALIILFKSPKAQSVIYSYHSSNQVSYLKDANLWLMYISAFLQKALANLSFVIIPLVLLQDFNIANNELWKFYTPAGILGILAIAPATIVAEKYGRYKTMMVIGILAFILCFVFFCISDSHRLLWLFSLGIFVFFMGFNIHEPIMQSLTSRYPHSSQRSSALGLFTTCGFLGSFLGAILGGVLYSHVGLYYLSLGTGIVCFLWILALIFILRNPQKQKTLFLPLAQAPLNQLSSIQGIIDYYHTQDLCIISYDPTQTNEEKIKEDLRKMQ